MYIRVCSLMKAVLMWLVICGGLAFYLPQVVSATELQPTSATEQMIPITDVQLVEAIQGLVAAEYATWAKYGKYLSLEDLAKIEHARIGLGVQAITTRPDFEFDIWVPYYEDAPQRFVVLGYSPNNGVAYWGTETGEIHLANYHRSARWYGEVEPFFRQREDWVKQADSVVRTCIHDVQLAIERWSVDRTTDGQPDIYPTAEQFESELVNGGYAKAGFYPNPCCSKTPDELTAKEVPLGWYSPGDFSYYPYYPGNNTASSPTGYLLIGYGADRYGGNDYVGDAGIGQGITIVLAGGSAVNCWRELLRKELLAKP